VKKLTFLVVDNDENIARCVACSVQDILADKNLAIEFEVLCAIGPFKGLQHFGTKVIDFVISDLEMNQLNGEQLLQVVANISPSTEKVLMTANKHYLLPPSMSSIDILQKPLKDESLEAVINKALEHLLG